MDASMLGVGVGFDTKGAGTVVVLGPDTSIPVVTMTVDDSREGFVDAMRCLLASHLVPLQANSADEADLPARTAGAAGTTGAAGAAGAAGEAGEVGGSNSDGNGNSNGGGGGSGRGVVEFDYSQVRAAGLPIKGFGGTSSGSGPLRALLEDTHDLLHQRRGQTLSVTCIVDIMNMIGRCVVSGNVRRTAEIAFGDPDSEEYIDLKDYDKNPHRASYGWTSNNSVFASVGNQVRAYIPYDWVYTCTLCNSVFTSVGNLR
jgi:hypothetical protein